MAGIEAKDGSSGSQAGSEEKQGTEAVAVERRGEETGSRGL